MEAMKAKAAAKAKELAAAGAAKAGELAPVVAAKATEAAKAGASKAQEMGHRAADAVETAFTEVYEELPEDNLGAKLLATDVFKGSELMRMHDLCGATYGSRWEGETEVEGLASGEHPPWEEVHFDAKHNLRVVGAVCDDRRVEIAFRGTVMDEGGSKHVKGVGLDNAQTDANVKLVTPSSDFFFKLGREPPGRALVHKGFQDAYAHLSGPVAEWLKSRGISAEDSKARISGHSLGGALATLSFLELSLQGYDATLVTLGCPRVGNADFAAWVRSEGRHSLIARLVNEGDPITWGPPHMIKDTYHTYSHVCAATKVQRLAPATSPL